MPVSLSPWTLPANPTASAQAANKSYVDTSAQPADATLTALAGLATGADKVPYSTGTDTFAQADLTSFARTLLDDPDAATARGTLGAAPTASPTFTGTVTAVREIKTPQTQSVTTTLNIDASTGDYHQITATGNPAMAVPTGGSNGQMLLVEVLASGGARTVTLNGAIILASGQSATMVIAAGKVGIVGLRNSTLAGGWVLMASTQTV